MGSNSRIEVYRVKSVGRFYALKLIIVSHPDKFDILPSEQEYPCYPLQI